MQQKNYYEFENIDDSTIEDVKEYALYSIETERTMRETEKKLSDIADPKKAAMVIMKAAIVFYEADWCGIINVDSDVGVWTPLWWCNDEFEEMVRTDVNEFELLEQYKRWLDCLSSHEPMVIEDIEEVKDSYPD